MPFQSTASIPKSMISFKFFVFGFIQPFVLLLRDGIVLFFHHDDLESGEEEVDDDRSQETCLFLN